MVAQAWEAWRAEVEFAERVVAEATVTRKLPKPMPRRTARDILETYGQWAVYSPVPADVVAASRLEETHRLAFWDALVVVAAQRSDAAVLLSEGLQDGRRIEGLRISNPLL